ncbi:MAG: response regulator [Planctomycetota bacterium]
MQAVDQEDSGRELARTGQRHSAVGLTRRVLAFVWGLALLSALLSAITAHALGELEGLAAEVCEHAELYAPLVDASRQLENAHADQVLVLASAVAESDGAGPLADAVAQRAERRVKELSGVFAASVSRLRSLLTIDLAAARARSAIEADEAQLRSDTLAMHLQAAVRSQTAFETEVEAVLAALRAGEVETARRLQASVDAGGPAVRSALGRMLDYLQGSIADAGVETKAFVTSARRTVLVLMVAVLLGTVLGSVWFVRSLVRSVRGIVVGARGVAQRLQDEHFAFEPLVADEAGEIGQIADAFNAVGERLAATLTARDAAELELRSARDAALDAARMKAQFLANMSHEIRTPLNGVIGMTGLLLETAMSAEQRDFAETIRSSGDQLLALINDILDLSKVEAGRMQLECVDFSVRAVVEESLDLLVEQAERKGIEFGCLVDETVASVYRGDPGRLRQVLLNLIGNAVKFTSHGEVVVRVAVEGESEAGTSLAFEVQDTGIGLTPEQQARIFQPFVQADASTTRKFGGSGLGLAISRKIVELMGGVLGVRSELGVGSTFAFRVVLPKAETAVTAPLVPINLRGRRALVVDDNPTNCRILKTQLSAWGLAVDVAESGSAALGLLRSAAAAGRPYEVAMLDYLMPEMDGLRLARHIKSDESLAGTRLALLTSVTWHGDIADVHAAGIDLRLTKPVRRSRVFDAVCQLVSGVAADPVLATERPEDARPTFSGLRLLVAEDNSVNLKVMTRMLGRLGCRADAVGNGVEAVEAARRVPYDIILMDCQMPEMDGYEATSHIRREGGVNARTVIVAVTANALQGDRERCHEAGMDDYLAKPVKLEALQATLARWAGTATASTSES